MKIVVIPNSVGIGDNQRVWDALSVLAEASEI